MASFNRCWGIKFAVHKQHQDLLISEPDSILDSAELHFFFKVQKIKGGHTQMSSFWSSAISSQLLETFLNSIWQMFQLIWMEMFVHKCCCHQKNVLSEPDMMFHPEFKGQLPKDDFISWCLSCLMLQLLAAKSDQISYCLLTTPAGVSDVPNVSVGEQNLSFTPVGG